MEKSARRKKRMGAEWLPAFLRFFMLAIAGLLIVSPGTALAGRDKIIWQSREQFVAIEKQDGAGTAANDHPAKLSSDQLRSMLESPETTDTDKNKPLPVFNEPEREILVEMLRDGLSLAGPKEDVTFAVIGQFPALMGLARERKVTTGRVFYRGGELNIIFGMLHRDFKDNEDRRLVPFVPGSRARPAELGGRISAAANLLDFSMKRGDWIVFSPASIGAAPGMPGESATPAMKPEQAERRPPETDTSRKQESKPVKSDRRVRTVEERLMLLIELRNKKLITEEEYRTKRLEILNEL
jgi:hypothetical protein